MTIETVFLGIFSFGALAGAVALFFLRHPMRVALALIGTMLSLAAIYAQLGLHVIAVFQVLIYVGAVMVFMVYAIMLLDVRDRSFTERFSPLLVAGLAGLLLLAGVLVDGLLRGEPIVAVDVPADTFSVGAFATAFMDEYWVFFALAAVLLLVAEIAASAVIEIRRRGEDQAAARAAQLRRGEEGKHG
ncbi:NADH-ubiquinone oxidoreductase chain J [Thioalkalivibrio nitratireducens DSM 14787]|uniref:NADH-quinone oxidoreductase subunit J n=1 Tax=Thioalkalivibrio nitratireducens (strain DSM 14787 / UNIQEM 213 / ALEN2) TaxID=1255043 RepID=L0DX29_THIND|nr:NADH-quinone oxidoreductase subunit J [Thioalkalivibrio nitratireducens]AGA33608.1 NADH-ubiquinone oxidoreductase chain J [Thioalkalivibrio nitratireducens DSM 14787]